MALLLRHPCWRRCLRGAGRQRRHLGGSTPACQASSDKPFESIQDPTQTRKAYSGGEAGERKVPGPEDEGVEREVKWGGNIPASAEQAKEEVKSAGQGLAESVGIGVNVLLSKAKDTMAAAQRALGSQPGRGEMSKGTMGAAGKMDHPPPGHKEGWNRGTLSEDLARSKYDEISSTEKPHYPAGEQSVNDKFPDMSTAAHEQSLTPERQRSENERIRSQLRPGGTSSEAGTPLEAEGDTLSENLHNHGP